MEKEEININGYILEQPLSNDNSGFSKWGFADKDGKRYFIKEFLAPKYPIDDSAICEKQKNDRLSECKEFQVGKIKLYSAINTSSDGNIVKIHDFFRQDSRYYITTEVVYGNTLSIQDIFVLPEKQRLLVCLVVSHAVAMLHSQHIVHADLKPDNILVTNESHIKAKLIDFDCSFFDYASPKLGEELNGDLVYLSPEAFIHMAELNSYLTCQMDIFSLGIILHQYLTGEMPQYNKKKYDYIYEAVLDKAKIEVDKALPEEIREVIQKMLKLDPDSRPNAIEVYQIIFKSFQYAYGENKAKMVPDVAQSEEVAVTETYVSPSNTYTNYTSTEMYNNAYGGYDMNEAYNNVYCEDKAVTGTYNNVYNGYDMSGSYDSYSGYNSSEPYNGYANVNEGYNNAYNGYDTVDIYNNTYSGYDTSAIYNNAYSEYNSDNNVYSYYNTTGAQNSYAGSEDNLEEPEKGYMRAGSLKGDLYNREIKKETIEKEEINPEEKSFFSSAGNL